MSWKTVSCHTTVKNSIIQSISNGVLGRTILIHGPSGAGQESVGYAIAKHLNCKKVENDFCDRCYSCQRIEDKTFPDVLSMYPWDDWSDPNAKEKKQQRKKNEYSVDHMREVQRFAYMHPYQAEKKIFLIHNADRMNNAAANSLLKILEEPHPHVVFILMTDQVGKIIPTIRSRCWPIRLVPLEIDALIETLQAEFSYQQSVTIARAAGGLPDLARILVDNDYLKSRDDMIDRLIHIKQYESAVVEQAERLAKEKDEISSLLVILMRLVHDGILIASGAPKPPLMNPDRENTIRDLWENADIDLLLNCEHTILTCLDDLERFLNSTILFTDLYQSVRRSFSKSNLVA